MKKIGILCYPTYGGSGIVATELGMTLANKRYEIHFISDHLPARLEMTNPNIFFHKVNLQFYPLFQYQPYDIALSSMIYRVVSLYKLDLLHVHYAIPYAYAAFMAKQMLREEGKDIPLVTTLHGTEITTVSESLRKDTLQFFNINKDIQVINNFIDNELFIRCTKCDRSQFATPEEKILIHTSNLRPIKRIGDVLQIFKNVNSKIPSKLVIIGEGPDMEIVTEFLEINPDLIDRIRLLGKTKDLYKILELSDLFLLPSSQESFGLAALEAMAAYTPIVSSNAGGIPEVNIDGETGFLANVGDVDKMSADAIKILSDENLLQRMKENAKKQAIRFDIKNIIPQYETMYEQVLVDFNKK